MKIAFIVQRYGSEILGGSEYHCRLVAEHLSSLHEVDVLTTCAREYTTWENAYPKGTDRIRGVTVHRFPNAKTRNLEAFNSYSDWIFSNPHTSKDEEEWLEQQGPWCPDLIEYLERKHSSYDALIFFTYLYAPTVLGLRVDARRSILVPTAHDEPAIRLDMYKEVFARPAVIAYNTSVERSFLRNHFTIGAKAEETVGCGIDLPLNLNPGHVSPDGVSVRDYEEEEEEEGDRELSMSRSVRGAVFKRRHRLYEPFVLYGGRIDPGKGCEELIEYFSAYATDRNDTTLALMGIKLMPIPDESFIRFAGMLSETERLEALEAATVVVVPSPYESLSLLALEAFSVGTPVLVNARSDVLTDHCQRSNGGLYYADCDEFVESLKILMDNPDLRDAMGRNGYAYVKSNYSWNVVIDKYERMITAIGGSKRNTRSARRSRGRGGKSAKRPNLQKT